MASITQGLGLATARLWFKGFSQLDFLPRKATALPPGTKCHEATLSHTEPSGERISNRDIVAVGASAGGMKVLRLLASEFRGDFPAWLPFISRPSSVGCSMPS